MVHFPWMPQARATARLATRVAHLCPGQLRFKAAGECFLQVKRRLKSPAPNSWIHRICSTQCFRMESASFGRRQNHSALKCVQSRHITTILFSELLKWLWPFGLVCSLEDHLDTWFNGGTPKIDTCLSTSPVRFLPTSSLQCPKIPYRSCCLRWMAMDGNGWWWMRWWRDMIWDWSIWGSRQRRTLSSPEKQSGAFWCKGSLATLIDGTTQMNKPDESRCPATAFLFWLRFIAAAAPVMLESTKKDSYSQIPNPMDKHHNCSHDPMDPHPLVPPTFSLLFIIAAGHKLSDLESYSKKQHCEGTESKKY